MLGSTKTLKFQPQVNGMIIIWNSTDAISVPPSLLFTAPELPSLYWSGSFLNSLFEVILTCNILIWLSNLFRNVCSLWIVAQRRVTILQTSALLRSSGVTSLCKGWDVSALSCHLCPFLVIITNAYCQLSCHTSHRRAAVAHPEQTLACTAYRDNHVKAVLLPACTIQVGLVLTPLSTHSDRGSLVVKGCTRGAEQMLKHLLLSWRTEGYYSSSVFRMKTIHCRCLTAKAGTSPLLDSLQKKRPGKVYVLQRFLISSSLEAPLMQFGLCLLLWEHGKTACPQPRRETWPATFHWLPSSCEEDGRKKKSLTNLSRATVNTAECELVSLPRETWIYPNTMLCGVTKNKPDFTVVPCYVPSPSPDVPAPEAAILRGPSKLCCRQDPHFTGRNLPAGPKLLGPGFLFFSLRVWTGLTLGASGHEGGVNESINTAILINRCAECSVLQLMHSCFERMWRIHRILINLDRFTFIEGFYYSFFNFVCPPPPTLIILLFRSFLSPVREN